jgi:hypothetical protein
MQWDASWVGSQSHSPEENGTFMAALWHCWVLILARLAAKSIQLETKLETSLKRFSLILTAQSILFAFNF